ncbi:hypothetical protein REPUB_Repub06bG0041000 [Reevesia pubescens]
MATGGISSVNSEKISHRFTRALSSAFLEWPLIFMLFIDSIISFLITKFAHKCKLQTPCLLCSRLDHVFGNEKLKFYWDLVCGDHKLEISSLVYCHAHNKLVDVHGMCESCLFSFATINKSNAETYRLLVGKLGEDFDCGLEEDPSLEHHKLGHSTIRHCSCCGEPWMPKGYAKTLIQTQSTVSHAAECDLTLPVSVEHGQDDQNRSENVSISVKATHQRKNGPHPFSHVAYTELKITSDSESEVSSDAGNEEDALIIQADHLQRDIVDQHVQPESCTITLSDDLTSEKLIDPVSTPKPSIFISQSQSDIIEPLRTKSVQSTDSSRHGLEEPKWKQASSKSEPSAFSELISLDDVPLSSKGVEASSDADDEEDALIIQTVHLQRDFLDQHVRPESPTITLSDDFASEKFMDPVSAPKPSIFISQSQSNIIEPLGTKSVESTDSSGHGLEELNWKQASSKIEPSAFSELVSLDDVPLSSKSVEASSYAGDEEDALIIQTDNLPRDFLDQHVRPESPTITLSDDFASEKLTDPVSAPKPSIFISQSQSDIIKPIGTKSVESTDSSGHGLEELNWKQASSKIEPSAFSELISLDDVSLSSKCREASIDVSAEMNLRSLDKVPPLSNAGEIPIQIQGSEDSKHISLDYVSSSSLGNGTPVEVSKESKPISIDDVSPSNDVASSVEESKESSIMRTLEVEKKSLTECEEICKSREQPRPIPESPIETNHVASDTSTQVPNSLDLSDAYKLAIGSKGRQLSGLLVEQWIGKDSSRLSEDLKVLLSQLSAARAMEQSMNDVSPRIAVSPRISINSDELKASDSSTFNGIQILQKRISLERNESGLSIDGSIVSEIEGESVADRLKRQVEHDRKLLGALYKELEEERNASAVAANQAMAMITRLQEEKATLHMEALQNLRIMEEQAEYDMEALQKMNDLLAEKEKEIQDLEAELEFYRMKFPNESMLEDIVMTAYDLKERQGIVDHSELNGMEERASIHTEPVSEKPNICSTEEETDHSFGNTNKGTMKNPLSGYEQGYHEEFIP